MEKTERWMELCKQASQEKDPEKLLELTNEIARLLDEKAARIKGKPPSAPKL